MRDIFRLSLTLAVVAIISASLLTGVYSVTDPIISDRQEKDYFQALEEFFPAIDQFETREIEGERFDLVYDQAGEKLGVMATVGTQGYDGKISYNLAVDTNSEIIGVRIISHTETPGIGDVITTDNFQEQFIGKGFDDPIRDGEDVDSISGATLSTGAMIDGIRRTITQIGEEILGRERKAFDPAEVGDGIYQGSVEGTHGPLTVEVEIADGVIKRVDIVEQNETETYFIDAYPEIPERIVEEQKVHVDTRTGSTLSAERIIAAVENALEGEPVDSDGGGESNEGE